MTRHLLASALAALLALGCASTTSARRPGEERLKAVKFEGNKALKSKTLLSGLALKRTLSRERAPDPYVIQVDADRIRGDYLRRGYLDVDVRSRVERKADDATVIYTVEEGTRAVTRTVITGLPEDVPQAKVREALPLVEGQPFDYETYDLAKPGLLNVLQDAGYAHATLDATVVADRANRTAIVQLAYTPGPKAVFGTVEISGVSGDLAQSALERVTFNPGQTYSTQAIVQTQRNLYGFGRFSTVQVQPDKTGGETVGVKVSVAEGSRHEVKLGGGFGMDTTAYEVRGRAGYSIAGWPFPLDTVSLDLRPAYAYIREPGEFEPRVRALAKLERKDLLWTYATGTVEVGYNYLTVEAYTSYGPLARLGFETRVLGSDKVRARVGWGIERLGFRRISPLIDMALREELNLDSVERVGAFTQALIVDLRDHPIDTTLGAYGEFRISEGTQFAGGEFDYIAISPDLRGYVPLLGGAVLAAHARYAGIHGDVPPTERFFSGGSSSQRGFAERRLSPFVEGIVKDEMRTVAYGGAAMVNANLEARMPVGEIRGMPFGVVGFLDGGDVTDKISGLDLMNLHWAVGAGLRLKTIVGPVRFDVGYRLNRRNGIDDPERGSRFAYHLTIGEAF